MVLFAFGCYNYVSETRMVKNSQMQIVPQKIQYSPSKEMTGDLVAAGNFFKLGFDLLTNGHSERTTGMEVATGRRIQGTGE